MRTVFAIFAPFCLKVGIDWKNSVTDNIYNNNKPLSRILNLLMKVVCTGERRDPDISEISRSHKALGRELEIPVVALSELNRQLEIYFEVDITQAGMSNDMFRICANEFVEEVTYCIDCLF